MLLVMVGSEAKIEIYPTELEHHLDRMAVAVLEVEDMAVGLVDMDSLVDINKEDPSEDTGDVFHGLRQVLVIREVMTDSEDHRIPTE